MKEINEGGAPMIWGKMTNVSKHTVIPKDDGLHTHSQHSKVNTYQLSQEELARYRAIPTIIEKKTVFIIPMRKQ